MTVLDDCKALKTFEEIYECTNREGQAVLYIKLKGLLMAWVCKPFNL